MAVRPRRVRIRLFLACVVVTSLLGAQASSHSASPAAPLVPPNILFIILDDVGNDQLAAFNPASGTAGLTPNIDTVVAGGVKFTNLWTMSECSPSRVSFFTGRYPLRTGVTAAILDQDLPAAQISPFEETTPRVLSTAGYASAMFGKYHLGGPENNPDGNSAPVALGWDYFNGNLRGGPPSIDVTLGGQYTLDKSRYSCGFPVGPERGASWFLGADNQARCDDNHGAGYTGLESVTLGGIPALDARGGFAPTCREAAGSGPDFTRPNGYYVWPLAIADASGVQTRRSRQYMTTAQTDAAIAWIRAQSQGTDRARPWMATVSYNSIHTPFQQPPVGLYPPGFVWPSNVPQDCTSTASLRALNDLMLAALDKEIGRLLVSVGLAQWDERGRLVYRPEATDTMVVIVGDNGSFALGVKAPYDPIRSKGTPYQTGISTPMIVSGPLVASPGRSVGHLVNAVDLFQLFGEIADVNVRAAVPASHVLDSEPVLDYLRHPNQPAIRRYNFTQLGTGLKPASVTLWPCAVKIGPVNLVTDLLFTTQNLCEDNSGRWFGPTADQPDPLYPTSCAVKESGLYTPLSIVATRTWALRNSQYKLVKVERAPCESSLGEFEFYDLSPRPPLNPVGLDLSAANLLTKGQPVGLTPAQKANFDELGLQLQALLDSEPACHGDGNLDKRVDHSDLLGVGSYQGQPSVFDFNRSGVTDRRDVQCVKSNFGNNCRVGGPGNVCR
jgi:hypothetical protein